MEIPHCKIIRFESPLYFANCDYFFDRIWHVAKIDVLPNQEEGHTSESTAILGDASVATLPEVDIPLEMITRLSPDITAEIEFVIPVPRTSDSPNSMESSDTDSHDTSSIINYIILDCSSMSFIDINGVRALQNLASKCRVHEKRLLLASCKGQLFIQQERGRDTVVIHRVEEDGGYSSGLYQSLFSKYSGDDCTMWIYR